MNRYDTLNKRIVALLVDFVVLLPIIVIEIVIFEWPMPTWFELVWVPTISFAAVGYHVLMQWRYGQTLGKMAAGVKVLDVNEQPIAFRHAFLREIAYVISGVISTGLGWYFVLAGFGRASEAQAGIDTYIVILTLAWLLIDGIVCLKNPKHRALHDFIGGTVVVRLDILNEAATTTHYNPPPPETYGELRDR